MKELAFKIRRLRELQNLTQQHLADSLGISQRAYSKIETGQTSLSVNRLSDIAAILDCPVESFLTYTAEELFVIHLFKKQNMFASTELPLRKA